MCFSVTPLNSVTSLDLTNSPIQLSKDRNLKVFIHEPGDEFWIIRAIFPIHIDVISIEGGKISSNEAKSLIGLISHYKLHPIYLYPDFAKPEEFGVQVRVGTQRFQQSIFSIS